MADSIDGLIAVLIGVYFFLVGSGVITMKTRDPIAFERRRPLFKVLGAIVAICGVVWLIAKR